ncbi:MAG TPA: FAD-dependent oxidoreductase [Anaerolineales bacterium]|nr:FAD-dependent oxidoreductase [Anaerolineales bacterium]
MTRRYIVVGNGPAGVSAAETIRRHDGAGVVTIVGDEKVPFYSRPGLAYLLTGTIPEKMLFSRPETEYARQRLQREVGAVQAIDRGGHRVTLQGGRTLPYDRLLLAVGARALRPRIPGIELEGVVSLDNLEDARRILRLARRARRACVVGGGITAVELAEGLAAQHLETHYLMRKDRYWGGVLEPAESALIEDRLTGERIRLHRQTDLAAVVGRRGRVAAVETQSGERLPCDLLAVAIGTAPRVELARQAGLATGRGILTDAEFRTEDPDIFAAGDVAEVFDPATGEHVLDSLWSVAIEQGRAAGQNLAGAAQPYRRQAPFNVTRIGGVTTTLIGAVGSGGRDDDLVALARGDSQAWRQRLDAFAVVSDEGANRVRLHLGREHVVGAMVMGDQTLSRPLQQMIRDRVDIRPVRERLLRDPAHMAQVVLSLANPEAHGAR